jgi:hypothetical protein
MSPFVLPAYGMGLVVSFDVQIGKSLGSRSRSWGSCGV